MQAQARPQAAATAASGNGARQLTVAALELPSRDDAQWKQRREQVAQLLTELQPDVISVQQVLQQQGRNPACWLASRLRYSCDFVTADPPSQPLRHGNAMLTRLPVSEDGVTLLHPPGTFSAAGMMRLKLGEALVNVYGAAAPGAGRGHRPPAPDQRPDDLDRRHRRRHAQPDRRRLLCSDRGTGAQHTGIPTGPAQSWRPARGGRGQWRGSTGHGLDVLFQVKHFDGIRQQPILLPADGDLPGCAWA